MSSILVVVLLGIGAVIVVQVRKYIRLIKSTQNIPGPVARPILGNAIEIGSNPADFLKNLFRWWQKYGPDPYRVWIMNRLFVLISDPKDIEVVLLSNPQLRKADLYELLHPWLGEGLLNSYGSTWFKRRKMITPTFHFSILINFFDIMNKTSDVFINKLKEKAKTDEVFDIQSMLHYCTLDIICETAMGVNIDSMNNPKCELAEAFNDLCEIMIFRSFNLMQYNKFIFQFTENHKINEKALGIVKSFTTEVIEQRRKLLEKSKELKETGNDSNPDEFRSKKRVFLDTLLTATIDGQPLNSVAIYEEVATFMFGGHDTTKSTLSFAVYCLSRHLEVQEKAFEEQQMIFGKNLTRSAVFQDLAQMKYLDLVLKECQRIFPSVPYVSRGVHETFDLNGKKLAPGTTIMLLLIGMGYNEKYFPDPHKFNPQRFESNGRNHTNPFHFIPFSAGPRNCIGQKFAIMEMKCILSKIIRNFEILPASDDMPPFKGVNFGENLHKYEPFLSGAITLKSESGINVRLRSRNL